MGKGFGLLVFAINVVLPGVGSVVAGKRVVGIAQVLLFAGSVAAGFWSVSSTHDAFLRAVVATASGVVVLGAWAWSIITATFVARSARITS